MKRFFFAVFLFSAFHADAKSFFREALTDTFPAAIISTISLDRNTVSYSICVVYAHTTILECEISGSSFPPDIRFMIARLKPGSRVIISKILVRNEKGSLLKMPARSYIVGDS
ncbi:MAG TPA: hypothetical protein VI731_09765 [Bacteroidia bacterium]|nr:hypothetical protein [Bacteroidia bacterium]